ncbi:MAG: glycosyltransferase family 2 protein [Bacilli bacterium]|nr:glycosyltransferase family 2 protein [Bacilli bacterium]
MKISAVVVTYNRKDLLIECLNAILNQTREVDEIILIDNNSNDGTHLLLNEKKYFDNEKIIYKKLDKNIGGSGGFYEGFKLAIKRENDWIWIMDDDTIPNKNCLEQLLNAKNKINDKISYLASTVYGENKEFMNVPTINEDKIENGYSDWYKYLSDGIVKIKCATFVSLLINCDAIKNIGYPVKDYFIWGDDTEYTLRLNKYYGSSYFVGDSIAIHKRKLSKALSIFDEDNKGRIKIYYYMYRNNLINIRNYNGKKEAFKQITRNFRDILKLIIKPNKKYNLYKCFIISKATFAYLAKRHDYKAFKNRFDLDVQYKKV